jgi:hypothetical protein
MGAVKQMEIEEANREHIREVREWQRSSKRRRRMTFAQAEEEYELEQAFLHALEKDD